MAKKMAKKGKTQTIDAGRAETEKYQPSDEVQREFAEAAQHGPTGGQEIVETFRRKHSPSADLAAGDVDTAVDPMVGDESPGGDNPTPDQSVVEEIGKAEGLTYEDDEPLRPTEKIEARDRDRWELDPASSEDYAERTKPES